jgi:drug/metabolite transporter (DMT)-like permease
MKMKTNLSKIVTIFVVLTIAGVCLVVFGQGASESAVRTVLPLLGAAIFGAGLTFFLLRMTAEQK